FASELSLDQPGYAQILVSAGFGITINPTVLELSAAAGPAMLDRMARGVVADPSYRTLVANVRRDFEDGGAELLRRHMRVLADHRPRPPQDLPPTFVVWGTRDPGVPLAAHAELALRCGAP